MRDDYIILHKMVISTNLFLMHLIAVSSLINKIEFKLIFKVTKFMRAQNLIFTLSSSIIYNF